MSLRTENFFAAKSSRTEGIQPVNSPLEKPKLFSSSPAQNSDEDKNKIFTFYSDGTIKSVSQTDENGRIKQEKFFDTKGKAEVIRDYDYDDANALKCIGEYNLKKGKKFIKIVDNNGNLIQTIQRDNITDYSIKKTYTNNVLTSQLDSDGNSVKYYSDGKLKSKTTPKGSEEYDKNGNILIRYTIDGQNKKSERFSPEGTLESVEEWEGEEKITEKVRRKDGKMVPILETRPTEYGFIRIQRKAYNGEVISAEIHDRGNIKKINYKKNKKSWVEFDQKATADGYIKNEYSQDGKLTNRIIKAKNTTTEEIYHEGELINTMVRKNGKLQYFNNQTDEKTTKTVKNGKETTTYYYNAEGKIENEIITEKDKKRTIHYNENGEIAYIKEQAPGVNIVKVNIDGKMEELVNASHKKISANHYQSVVNGTSYDIKYTDDSVEIINNNTRKTKHIDLERLLRKIAPKDRAKYIETLKNLNGEILTDLSVEVTSLSKTERKSYDGIYEYDFDNVSVEENAQTLTHELGHAIDWTLSINTSSVKRNDGLVKNFSEERLNYFEKGGDTIDFNDDSPYTNRFYATVNEHEMFAETYTMLTMGENNSMDTILQYFPKTMMSVKKHLEAIRKMEDNERH